MGKASYEDADYQLVEDCLRTAVLARELDRPRTQVDGRFDRAESIARKRGDERQLFRVIYERARTAHWWFNDFAEFKRLYKLAEPLVIGTDLIWDLENLVNLWQMVTAWLQAGYAFDDADAWANHTKNLRAALTGHASIADRPTSALWARTELLLMDLTVAAPERTKAMRVFANFKDILVEAEGHLDYPVGAVVEIIQEFGPILGDDETYDEVFEAAVALQGQRSGDAEQGLMRLERGFQKLKEHKTYDAIDQLSKAQRLLAQDENKPQFIQALVGTALGYEAAGLLWAARANLIIALDRTVYEDVREGSVTSDSLPLIRKLIWLELQLGRVLCALAWWEYMQMMSIAAKGQPVSPTPKEYEFIDVVLGILVLRTRFEEWDCLDKTPGLLQRLALPLSRGAALFALGHDDVFRAESGQDDDDLDKFFSLWLHQPAAADLAPDADWHRDDTILMRTVIMGCEIELAAVNNIGSILIGEAILAFFESFLATAMMQKGVCAAQPRIKIAVRPAKSARVLIHRTEEDDCGEVSVVVEHPKMAIDRLVQTDAYQEALFKLLATLVGLLNIPPWQQVLERLFAVDRAQDRALLAARSPLSLTNQLGEKPKFHLEDWITSDLDESLKLLRETPWEPQDEQPITVADSPEGSTFGVDALKHRDVQIFSPINLRLWNMAKWCGLGFIVWPDHPVPPGLILIFNDIVAGKKIFRGWRKQLGEADEDQWIGVTLITGIDRKNPAHYRLQIGIDGDYIERKAKPNNAFMAVTRMQEMSPLDTTNLDNFLEAFERVGCYRLLSGIQQDGLLMPEGTNELFLEKSKLRVVPAWQVGPNDSALMALRGIDDPLIPPFVTKPPIWDALARLSETGEDKGPVGL